MAFVLGQNYPTESHGRSSLFFAIVVTVAVSFLSLIMLVVVVVVVVLGCTHSDREYCMFVSVEITVHMGGAPPYNVLHGLHYPARSFVRTLISFPASKLNDKKIRSGEKMGESATPVRRDASGSGRGHGGA